jgi:hypothetical protein
VFKSIEDSTMRSPNHKWEKSILSDLTSVFSTDVKKDWPVASIALVARRLIVIFIIYPHSL